MMPDNRESQHSTDVIRTVIWKVFQLSSALRKRGERWAQTMGLTHSQWQLLGVAHLEPGKTVPQLARRAGLARQTVQRTADHLVKAGMSSYAPNPDHLRSPRFVVTDKGRRVWEQLDNIMRGSRAEFIRRSRLTKAELQIAEKVLSVMCDHADADRRPAG